MLILFIRDQLGLWLSSRLVVKQQSGKCINGLFAVFLRESMLTCEMVKHPQTFMKILNQHIQEFNRQFNGKINQFVNIVFAANNQKNLNFQRHVITTR